MSFHLAPFWLRLRLLALLGPVLLVLGLNGRAVATLRLPAAPPAGQSQASEAPRPLVVKQKVTLEAHAPLGPHVVPPAALGWEPTSAPAAWLPRLRRALAQAPRLAAGVSAGAAFRQRLLRAALSPQAP